MRETKMIMSNFIDEAERHAELYGKYTDRQRQVLELITPLTNTMIIDERSIQSLYVQGINNSEIEWLKRTGHLLPSVR